VRPNAAAGLKPARLFQLREFFAAISIGIPLARKAAEEAMARRNPKPLSLDTRREAIYAMQAEICRVLGHPRRIQTLDLLGDGEKSAAQLIRLMGIGKVNLSQHMALLKSVGLVEAFHHGRTTSYRLSFVEIKDACRLIREVLAARLRKGASLAQSLGKNSPALSFAGGKGR
jgi:ArsR family transcriptional regulator, virulence genes transcriptional regulator